MKELYLVKHISSPELCSIHRGIMQRFPIWNRVCVCVRLFLVEEVEKPSMWPIQRDVCHPMCLLFVLLKLESNHARATNDIHVFEDRC